MAYTPVASQVTQPLDTVDRSTAAAEFRELKAHINGISTVASAATPDVFNSTNKLINYTGTVLCTNFAAAPQAGASRLIYCAAAAQFQANANITIDGTPSGNLVCAAGWLLQVLALTTTSFKLVVISPVIAAVATDTVSKTGTGSTYVTNTAPTITNAGLVTPTVSGQLTRTYGAGKGIVSQSADNNAVEGQSLVSGYGVYGFASNVAGLYAGVKGEASNFSTGVQGVATNGYGIVAESDTTSPRKSAFRLVPQDADPTSPQEGDIYFNGSTKNFLGYNGTIWAIIG